MTAVDRNKDSPPSGGAAVGGAFDDDPWRIDTPSKGLIDSPIEFLFAEHQRQRQAAQILLMIADDEFDRGGVGALVEFLENDFANHVADEEIALFPILRSECLPEDNIDALIARLADEHREDEGMGEQVIEVLKSRIAGKSLTENDRRRLRYFSEHIRQHIALENGVLLPIARVRLGDDLLNMLSTMLMERRVGEKTRR